ncbi:MAG: septation protein IspZ [Sphingomonadales bacterium]|nr:septation protein IspZ [Sphingomonadales bacterium]
MNEAATPAKPKHGTLSFALDFGPLLLFFIASKLGSSPTDPKQGAIVGTAVFMAAIIVAAIISRVKLGRISPMLKLTAGLGVFFGALTLWFHDERRGRALLRYVLEAAYDGLNDTGWLKLSLNWGLFFAALALANEAMRAMLDFDLWLTLKVWGVTIVTFIFALANIPMLMRHGLKLGEEPPAPPQD